MRRMATAAVALALLLAGCGGSGEPAAGGEVPTPPTTASPASTSTTVSTAEIEQAVVDAYLTSWEAYHAASDPADPTSPALAETMTGPALEQAVESLEAFRITGRVGRFPEGSIAERHPEVVSLLGQEATVRDCRVDDSQIVIAATGEVVNDLVGTARYEASMVAEDGRWKVRSLTVVEEWEGVAGCALD